MCDYSLMMVPNRLALEGEELVAHKFQSGTTGFVSYSDFTIWRAEQCSKSLWHRLKGWFASKPHPTPVVCIPKRLRNRSAGGRTLAHPSWRLSPSFRPKRTSTVMLYVSTMGQ